jgi:hypothetical protein
MSEFDNTPTEELRAQLAAYVSGEQKKASAAVLPLPPAANRATLSAEQQETLFENWVTFIYDRPSNTWTEEEKSVIKVAISRAL